MRLPPPRCMKIPNVFIPTRAVKSLLPGPYTAPGLTITESEPARLSVDEFGSAIARLKEAGVAEARNAELGRESSQHFWQYALAAMMVALAVEGVVARRTI